MARPPGNAPMRAWCRGQSGGRRRAAPGPLAHASQPDGQDPMHSQYGVLPQVSSNAIGQRETPLRRASLRLAFLVLRLALFAIHFCKLAATPRTSICLAFDQVRSGKHGPTNLTNYSFARHIADIVLSLAAQFLEKTTHRLWM